jgi:hypothetical protein
MNLCIHPLSVGGHFFLVWCQSNTWCVVLSVDAIPSPGRAKNHMAAPVTNTPLQMRPKAAGAQGWRQPWALTTLTWRKLFQMFKGRNLRKFILSFKFIVILYLRLAITNTNCFPLLGTRLNTTPIPLFLWLSNHAVSLLMSLIFNFKVVVRCLRHLCIILCKQCKSEIALIAKISRMTLRKFI